MLLLLLLLLLLFELLDESVELDWLGWFEE
jgi:hypothetical protein